MNGLPPADVAERVVLPPSEAWRARARAHLDTLTKPLGSLGRLEELAAQMVSIRQDKFHDPVRKAVYVFAADHGVTAEGVSAYPSEVTRQMVLNFVAQGAAVNVLAKLHGADLRVVDVGVDGKLDGADGVVHRKIRMGTRNMLHEAAMSEDEVTRAIAVGAECANDAAQAGCTMVAVGEMGIGNTTAASAITCALVGCAALAATGRGTGLGDEAHVRKVGVVEAILAKHFGGDASSRTPVEILRCVGGLEIAAMTGMMLAAASHRLVIVVDGFISAAAAALAVAMEANVRGYLVAGHRSQEPGHRILLDSLGLTPVLTLDMRLGEGSGALLAMPILESAICLYQQMATFASAGVSEAAK